MKNFINSARRCIRKPFAWHQPGFSVNILIFSLMITIVYFFGSCKKETADEIKSARQIAGNATVASSAKDNDATFANKHSFLNPTTVWELLQARAATARYRHFENALKDGYADINVVIPGMGYHYLKAAVLDATFEFKKPEILVYNKDEDGHMELVALEYAVPISLSPDAPPAGFTGNADKWGIYEGQLWTLHAWVWSYNPEGVFNATNPLVHLH